MKNKLKISLLFTVLILFTITCSTSCNKSAYAIEQEKKRGSEYDSGYEEGLEDGKWYGYEIGLEDGKSFGYDDGYDDAFDVFSDIVNYEAVRYARKYSDFHPEEAMCIIDCYESGKHYCGTLQITQDVYKDAVKSLYYYYDYFYCGNYKE